MAQIRTLVVDDNPAFLRSVSRLISSYKEFEIVGEASSAAEALKQIALSHPDLVLMDMVMSDLSGLDATRIIKAESDAPRVIICTLYGDARYAEAATAAGADGFLSKSALSKQLLQVVYSLFSSKES
ncbi:MAG: response regulator transcription factor [Chloroflexota bacterium]